MLGLFGIGMHSLTSVYDNLKKYVADKNLNTKILLVHSSKVLNKNVLESIENSDVIIFSSYVAFCMYAKKLDTLKVITIIFDGLSYLNEINGLQILDCVPKKDFSYSFRLKPLDTKLLYKSFDLLKDKNAKHINFKDSSLTLIPRMITRVMEGKFLDKYNKFIYSYTNHKNRSAISCSLYKFLFGDIDFKQYEKEISEYIPKRGLGKKYYTDMITYLDTKEGKNLLKVLLECKEQSAVGENGKKKAVKYKALSKKYDVDLYEIKYLNLNYRKYKGFKLKNKTTKEILVDLKASKSKKDA